MKLMDKVITKREFIRNPNKVMEYLGSHDAVIVTNRGVPVLEIRQMSRQNVTTLPNVTTKEVSVATKYPEASEKLSDIFTKGLAKKMLPRQFARTKNEEAYVGVYGCGCSRTDKILCKEHGRY